MTVEAIYNCHTVSSGDCTKKKKKKKKTYTDKRNINQSLVRLQLYFFEVLRNI